METKIKDLITTRLKLKDAFPDLATEYGDDAEFVRKGIVPANLEIKDGERSVISYITTGAADRDQEIVRPQGADLKHYKKNPVVLFGHDYGSLPIGKNVWIKSDEIGLIAKTQYANHDEADKVYQYRKDGFPLAESIGFIPTQGFYQKWTGQGMKWDEKDLISLKRFGYEAEDIKDVRAVYTKWILLEYSDVAVPANPEATQIAIGKGLISAKEETMHVEFTEAGETLNLAKEVEEVEDLTESVCTKDMELNGTNEVVILDQKNVASIPLDGDICIKGTSIPCATECGCTACLAENSTKDDRPLDILLNEEKTETTGTDEIKTEDIASAFDNITEKEPIENTQKDMELFVKSVKSLIDLGVDSDKAVESILAIMPGYTNTEIKEVEPDEESLSFDLEEKQKIVKFDFDKSEICDKVTQATKESFAKFKIDIVKDVEKTAKNTINRLKGKMIKVV